MKKVSTVVTKQSRNFSQHKLIIGLDVGIARAATAFWMRGGVSSWNKELPPRPRLCKRHSERCRAAGWRWKPGRIRPG